jgi:hypothetical protein
MFLVDSYLLYITKAVDISTYSYLINTISIFIKGEMCRACSTHDEERNAYRVLIGKPEGKRLPGRPRSKWEDIRMNFREIGWGGTG